MNKTIYLRDGDMSTWDRARKLSGDRLSPIIMELLASWIKGQQTDQERIADLERQLVERSGK